MTNIPRNPPADYRPANNAGPNVVISPSSKVPFHVVPNKSTRSSITLSNNGSTPVAFKIKTTNPKRYLVKPNQGVIERGDRKEIQVIIAPERLQALIDAWASNDASELHDKFQVVSVAISDAVGQSLLELEEGKEQVEELNALWARVAKEDQIAKKLDVDFQFPDDGKRQPKESAVSRAEAVTEKPVVSAQKDADTQALSEEIANLRKKYDDLVTFTVTLTGERDALLSQLDTLKMDLKRELNAQADASAGLERKGSIAAYKRRSASRNFNSPREPVTDPAAAKQKRSRSADQGFSLFIVAVVGLIAFLAGRWPFGASELD